MTQIDAQNIASDKPVQKQSEDLFGRYGFAEGIANRISKSSTNDSVVIGVYGKWGEGKTSVINFIISELSKCEDVITFKFNPWRFTDEATLLVSFFNTLATEVVKALPTSIDDQNNNNKTQKRNWRIKKNSPLKSKKETVGDIIKKYGKIVSIFGAGETAEAIGKALSDVSVEDLKTRYEELLIKSGKKVAIFIDDIDRLDKSEIHSIFRLVKLTADFSNTFYVLSFDPEMVASAIGERFGDGEKEAGLHFLEKIIQVPLNVPAAQPKALQKLCFKLLNKAISESNIEFPEEEAKRFSVEFSEHLLPRFQTPREAIRFSNALSFAFPLLRLEVNYVDLMLIEGLKSLYPKHYDFVKHNPIYFTTPYRSDQFVAVNPTFEQKKEEIKQYLGSLSEGLSKKETESVNSLLVSLFPVLNEALGTTGFYSNKSNEWYKAKRIATPNYFNRYFSYSISEGELSDVTMEEVLSQLESLDEKALAEKFRNVIGESSPENFLHKMRSLEEDFNWEKSKQIAKAISLIGDVFPERFSFFSFGYDSPDKQAAIFIYQLVKNHSDISDCFELSKELMRISEPFEFTYEINNMLRTGKSEEDQLFNHDQYLELAMIMKDRALSESSGTPIFEKFPHHASFLFSNWRDFDKEGFDKYINEILDSDSKKVKPLIVSFVPMNRSSNHPEPYKTNLDKKVFSYITELIDKDLLYSKIKETYQSEIAEEDAKFGDFDHNQTDSNILRQFVHWYKKSMKENDENTPNLHNPPPNN